METGERKLGGKECEEEDVEDAAAEEDLMAKGLE